MFGGCDPEPVDGFRGTKFGVSGSGPLSDGGPEATTGGSAWWGTLSPPERWDASIFDCFSGDALPIGVSVCLVFIEDPGGPVFTKLLGGSVLTADFGGPVFTEGAAGPVLVEFLWGASTQPPVSKTSATLMDAIVAALRRT